jgi:hypothetical protein
MVMYSLSARRALCQDGDANRIFLQTLKRPDPEPFAFGQGAALTDSDITLCVYVRISGYIW